MKKNAIFALLVLFAPNAFAADVYGNVTAIGTLFISIGYMVGLYLFIGGLYGFYASAKYGNDPSRSFTSAFYQLMAGTLLLLPTTIYAISKGSIEPTWSMTNDNLALSSTALDGINKVGFLGYLPDQTVKTLFAMIWLIGLYGFLKGIYLIKFAGEQSNGQQEYSPMKKIFMHMIGGVVLMNIKDASHLVGSFFGWDWMKL